MEVIKVAEDGKTVVVTSEENVKVVESSKIAIPSNSNFDGGTAGSVFGGIPPIDGGNAT